MKKGSILIFLIITGLSSCTKDDKSLFERSPDERLNEKLTAYQSQLTGAVNGWKGFITTDSGRGSTYSFYFKFNDQNRVQMFSDFDSASAVTIKESSYRIKALLQPSLIFDTYSYVHLLADPDPSVNGGGVGAGLGSDFEFAFDNATTDTIKLTGRFHGSKGVLIRATKQEGDAYINKQLGNSLQFNNISKIFNYWKRITVGGIEYEVTLDATARTITFAWLDASGNYRTHTTTFYYTLEGVVLDKPLVNGNVTISSFRNIVWNATANTLAVSVNNVASTFVGAIRPLKIDLTAPRKWWQYAVDNQGYWATEKGFRINGVEDALRLSSIAGYNGFTIYYPNYVVGGAPYDLLAPITNGALEFAAAFRLPTFTTDGRVIFPFVGTLGTVPVAATSVYTNLRTKMAESTGFYLVQIDKEGLVYDMVSASDAKSWVRWEW
jgi:hypothetical protein